MHGRKIVVCILYETMKSYAKLFLQFYFCQCFENWVSLQHML